MNNAVKKCIWKVTLFDENTVPFVSGTASFFADDIVLFRKEWEKRLLDSLPRYIESTRKEKEQKIRERLSRFDRSLQGEIVTEYYPTKNDAELNIVQCDKESLVYQEKHMKFTDFDVTLYNAYRYPGDYHFEELSVNVCWICWNHTYYKVGMYKITGGYTESFSGFRDIRNYGNPVVKCTYKSDSRRSDAANFLRDEFESLVYVPFAVFGNEEELLNDMQEDTLTQEEWERLLMDLPGEGG